MHNYIVVYSHYVTVQNSKTVFLGIYQQGTSLSISHSLGNKSLLFFDHLQIHTSTHFYTGYKFFHIDILGAY